MSVRQTAQATTATRTSRGPACGSGISAKVSGGFSIGCCFVRSIARTLGLKPHFANLSMLKIEASARSPVGDLAVSAVRAQADTAAHPITCVAAKDKWYARVGNDRAGAPGQG